MAWTESPAIARRATMVSPTTFSPLLFDELVQARVLDPPRYRLDDEQQRPLLRFQICIQCTGASTAAERLNATARSRQDALITDIVRSFPVT